MAPTKTPNKKGRSHNWTWRLAPEVVLKTSRRRGALSQAQQTDSGATKQCLLIGVQPGHRCCEQWLKYLVSGTHIGNQVESSRLLAPTWPSPGRCGHLGTGHLSVLHLSHTFLTLPLEAAVSTASRAAFPGCAPRGGAQGSPTDPSPTHLAVLCRGCGDSTGPSPHAGPPTQTWNPPAAGSESQTPPGESRLLPCTSRCCCQEERLSSGSPAVQETRVQCREPRGARRRDPGLPATQPRQVTQPCHSKSPWCQAIRTWDRRQE